MQWQQLLSLRKQGYDKSPLRYEQDESRLEFEKDYDRIIFSSEFRSLQDKTQVVPLSKTGFVHTRLTHSLEVSVVARSLGRQVGKTIIERHPELKNAGYKMTDFGSIVAAASLAHDIGNPPFGHTGEKAIGNYFTEQNGKRFKSVFTEKQFQDLADFEGNANGFKILTQSRPGVEGGIRLTYATLGAFTKYPKESLPKKPTPHIADKKFGFFQSEKPFFKEIADDLGLIAGTTNTMTYHRHPLTYLVEAADDICYTIIDFEDGINMGLIQEDYALEYLIKLVKNNINSSLYSSLQNTADRLSYLRSMAISTLINEAVEIFLDNENEILDGNFTTSLTDKSKFTPQIEDILSISRELVYQSDEVTQKEISGFKILSVLLEAFTKAVENAFNHQTSYYDELILRHIPPHVYKKESLYESIIDTCSFVAGMTDGKALLTFKTLNGNNL